MFIQKKKIIASVVAIMVIVFVSVFLAPWVTGSNSFQSKVFIFIIIATVIFLSFIYEIIRNKITFTQQHRFILSRITASFAGLMAICLGVGVNMTEYPNNFKIIVSVFMGVVVLLVLRALISTLR